MTEQTLFIVYTGNRFNQILIFPTYDAAADFLRKATTTPEKDIPRQIKTPVWIGEQYLTVADR